MEAVLRDILEALRAGKALDDKGLSRILHAHNRAAVAAARAAGRSGPSRPYAKKHLLPYVLRVRAEQPELWETWNVDAELERRLFSALRMKPRRTASGVATVTVITRPAKCGGACLYCPSDVRMPKSYLHDEPACQRAERCHFDPYLQVAARLRTLEEMGHTCDKVELIVLGGTWSDYPRAYRSWFVHELFAALNDAQDARVLAERVERRRAWYRMRQQADGGTFARRAAELQARVDAGELDYNAAYDVLYGTVGARGENSELPAPSGADGLAAVQHANEQAAHRAVGLVVETRPDCITPELLLELRRLGCTKVQVGVQSLDDGLLAANGRALTRGQVAHAFELLRAFGFKIHAHFMLNLLGATPERDKADYRLLACGRAFQPDEVKLYPCALIGSSGLSARYAEGTWRPYDEEALVDVLCADLRATRPFTRISRMVRDFSAGDIVAGSRKANLRQLVEARLERAGEPVFEIRHREIGVADVDLPALRMEDISYETTNTQEHFVQWVDGKGTIAGFCRLSLPHGAYVEAHADELPVGPGEAMLREVHVYGRVEQLERTGDAAQHRGLGRKLVERACEIARAAGCRHLNVISAVGTRAYYRKLGFTDAGLYQRREL